MPAATARRSSPRRSPEQFAAKRDLALEIHRRLCGEYGCPIPFFHETAPLAELVSSLLSHRTRNADSGRAFKALRAELPTWPAVRDADEADLRELLAPCTWPEQKAPRVKEVLRLVTERVGNLEEDALDFLGDRPVTEARTWLESLPGVGPKTSAAVLNFSRLHRPALPVDSHHHRVAQRVGLIGKSVAVGPSHAVLASFVPDDWDGQAVYDHHEVFMLHGQRVCLYRSPKCGGCALLDLCPMGRERVADGGDGGDGAGRTGGKPDRPR